MKVVIYEDRQELFWPLTNLLPQFDLLTGMKTVADHVAALFKTSKIDFISRSVFGHKPVRPSDKTIYLSGRLLLSEKFTVSRTDSVLKVGTTAVGLVKHSAPFPMSAREIKDVQATIKGSHQVRGYVITNLWDLVALNEKMIHAHAELYLKKSSVTKKAYVCGRRRDLFIARDARVHKQVFLDATQGSIYIDHGAEIRPFTTIIGPSYVGPGTIVERAKISRSSIGPECRIGGEVEACIFRGFSNKHHDGFIGHSYVGEWVNLGAMTTNSDLKNNYGPVRVSFHDEEYDTGLIKLGCFIGDHTKLGIGTLIPTGAVIGSFVNFAGGGMMPKFVADFRWLTVDSDEKYDLQKAMNTAKTVMKRRRVRMSKQYEQIIRSYHGQICGSN